MNETKFKVGNKVWYCVPTSHGEILPKQGTVKNVVLHEDDGDGEVEYYEIENETFIHYPDEIVATKEEIVSMIIGFYDEMISWANDRIKELEKMKLNLISETK